MRTFEVTLVKIPKVKLIGSVKEILYMQKFIITSNTDHFDIPVPEGFAIAQVCEMLPPVIINAPKLPTDDEKRN